MESYLVKLGLNINFPFVLTMAALIWARTLSMLSVIPFLFGKPVPKITRVGASMVITMFLYPILVTGTNLPQSVSDLNLFALFLKEILIGLSLGFLAGMIFYGFQGAGQMIDNQRGVSLARILIPELGEQVSLSGSFLFHFAIVLFLLLGGHRIFLKAFVESYNALPLLEFPQKIAGLVPLIDFFARMTGKIFFISVQIAAPVIIAILMADIILGVANRFAPQINVWELGFNIRGYLGILILFLSMGLIASQVEYYTAEFQGEMAQSVELLKGAPPPVELKPAEPPLEEPHRVVPLK